MFADQPYKLEIIERVEGRRRRTPTTLDAGEVGAGETISVYRNTPSSSTCAGARTSRRPGASATSSCRRSPAPTGGATRRARCCSASTARRGSPRPRSRRTSSMLDEAEKRDHRRLATELDLLSFPSELGGGLAVWHPKGAIVRKLMEDYSRERHQHGGYEFVFTPHLTKARLFETSGHLAWYADGMYPPMEMDNGTYYMKPMNCPMHCLIFRSRQRSYRELPLRLFELGTVYRYERAGTLHGLMRIRGFTQDDSHIYCTEEQASDEIASLLDFVLSVLRAFGFDDFTFNLSTKDPDKYVGSDETGTRRPRRCARRSTTTAWSTRSRRATPRSTGRRSTSTSATPSAARGSCRRSSTTSTIPSASSSSTSAPTTPATGRSCCTVRCSARSSGSSACSSSTTPARSRRGWRRCRCACCRSPRPTRSTPRRSPTVCAPPAAASTSSTPTSSSASGSAPPSWRSCRTCSSSATTTSPTAPSASTRGGAASPSGASTWPCSSSASPTRCKRRS